MISPSYNINDGIASPALSAVSVGAPARRSKREPSASAKLDASNYPSSSERRRAGRNFVTALVTSGAGLEALSAAANARFD
jgi:hypothetical protein